MTERQATIKNMNGIHCRPSAEIVNAVKPYTGAISVNADTGESDLRSVLGLVSLGLEPGFTVTICVDGPDEEAQCQKLVDLFEKHYDYPPKD